VAVKDNLIQPLLDAATAPPRSFQRGQKEFAAATAAATEAKVHLTATPSLREVTHLSMNEGMELNKACQKLQQMLQAVLTDQESGKGTASPFGRRCTMDQK
jgi:hypothetical protein